MRTTISLALVAMFALGSSLAAPAHAQQSQPGRQPGMSQPGPSGSVPSSSGGQVIGSSYTAQVTGEVIDVDQSSGKLTLRTVDGQLTATFPPVAVQNVKKGDQVTVAIGLIETNPPAASPGMGSGSGTPGGAPSGSTGSPTQPGGGSTR